MNTARGLNSIKTPNIHVAAAYRSTSEVSGKHHRPKKYAYIYYALRKGRNRSFSTGLRSFATALKMATSLRSIGVRRGLLLC
jgi:hypothetical protein